MAQELYLAKAFRELEHELQAEIHIHGGKIIDQYGDLFVYEGLAHRPLWAQFVGKNPQYLKFESIGDGARHLLSLKKRWCSKSFVEHRRAELIQEKVFRYKMPKFEFLKAPVRHDWGFWSLIEKNRILYAENTDSPWPLGEVQFEESNEPPSRAYLKLWEVLSCYDLRPKAGEVVVDLGACPGGWTWVLSELGCDVYAIDKAPLDERVSRRTNVQFLKKDAFKLSLKDIPKPGWVFSDVICFPQDLLELVTQWQTNGVEQFVCTLKFKGPTDWETIRKFQQIPGGRIVHLCANKHELTFIKGEP